MELALQQTLLARLATDGGFRKRFFADPTRVAASEGLTAAAESLAKIHQEQMRQFVRVLRRRRLAAAGGQLPLTRKALGARFADLFHNYAASPPPGTRSFEDALGFARFLEQHTAAHGVEPAWAHSLLRYEAAKLEATWLKRQFTFRCLPHAVRKLAARLAAGDVPEGSHQRFTLALWWRASGSSRLRHWLG